MIRADDLLLGNCSNKYLWYYEYEVLSARAHPNLSRILSLDLLCTVMYTFLCSQVGWIIHYRSAACNYS